MKKALSIILALVLALTMALPAFAADHEIGLNEPQIIGNKNGDTETVVFTPEEDGIYKLSIEAKSGSLYDVCYYIDYDFIDASEFSEDEDLIKANCVFFGKKDTPVTAEFYNDMEESYRVSVEVSELSCDTLAEGESTLAIEPSGSFFTFVPENDGYYNFKSTGDYDPMIVIIDADDFDAYNDDNGFEDDFNFDLTASLEAGKTYLVRVTDYEGADSCDITVTYGATEKVETIYIDSGYEDSYSMKIPKNYNDWFYLAIAPTGAVPTADVKVTSSDESIVTVDYVDFEKGVAYFDLPSFAALLERLKNLKIDEVQPEYFENVADYFNRYKEVSYFCNSFFYSVEDISQCRLKMGDEPVLTGFPNMKRERCVFATPLYNLGVFANSECKEGAFEFVEYCLTNMENRFTSFGEVDKDEYPHMNLLNSIPLQKEFIEKSLGHRIVKYLDEKDKVNTFEYDVVANDKKLLEEMIANSIFLNEEWNEIYDVVLMETASYLNGEFELEHTIDVIQNRVSLILSEHR